MANADRWPVVTWLARAFVVAQKRGDLQLFAGLGHSQLLSELRVGISSLFPSLNPLHYGCHSSRSGSVSALVAAGASDARAMHHGRWRVLSTVAKHYARGDSLMMRNHADLATALSAGGGVLAERYQPRAGV